MKKMNKHTEHIFGLSGEDEYKVLEMLSEEKYQHSLQKGICPDCEGSLDVHYEPDGQDDYTTSLVCYECGFATA